jgi:hypothetical protein
MRSLTVVTTILCGEQDIADVPLAGPVPTCWANVADTDRTTESIGWLVRAAALHTNLMLTVVGRSKL